MNTALGLHTAPQRLCGNRGGLASSSGVSLHPAAAPLRPRRGARVQPTAALPDIVSTVASTAILGVGAWLLLQQEQQQEHGYEDQQECPRCHGSGLEPCHCTRWSDTDVGCPSCSQRAGYMKCRSCGGGGKAVPLLRPVKIESRESGIQRY